MITEEQKLQKTCTVNSCNNKHKAKGFCPTHYARFRSHGDPTIVTARYKFINPKIPTMKEHFESKFIKRDTNKCWLWTGAKDKNGYGDFNLHLTNETNKYKKVKAHRYSYELYMGKFKNSFLVCHSCDTPSCVNPNHLFLGTAADNASDMVKKKRSMSGERNNRGKLKAHQVIEIREKLSKRYNQTKLSKEYGVSRNTIKTIKNFQIWKDLEIGQC